MSNFVTVRFNVNGEAHELSVPARRRLLDILRADLLLTGTKCGCDIGECGACTVVMNGRAVCSCMVFACQLEGADIITIEGLGADGLHPLQQAFIDCHAVQCGFCTPGMIMSAYALLMKNPHPTDEDIIEAVSGNLCRCTGYMNIINAIREAAKCQQ